MNEYKQNSFKKGRKMDKNELPGTRLKKSLQKKAIELTGISDIVLREARWLSDPFISIMSRNHLLGGLYS